MQDFLLHNYMFNDDPSCTYLIIDKNLHGIVAPLNKHQLIGLSRYSIGEGCTYTWGGVRFYPHTNSKGIHLRQTFLHLGIHVVGSQGESQLKLVGWPVVFLT